MPTMACRKKNTANALARPGRISAWYELIHPKSRTVRKFGMIVTSQGIIMLPSSSANSTPEPGKGRLTSTYATSDASSRLPTTVTSVMSTLLR